jgi:predicted amidohydrolase YtcJ
MKTNRWLQGRLLASIAFVLPGVLPAFAQQPDLILTNGKIVTVDDRFRIAQAMAIKGERIVAVGDSHDIARLAGPDTRRLNLHSRTVIPGLIDNHTHFIREADLGSTQNGKYAGLVVLDRDYLKVPADQIKDIRPLATMAGGKFVYDALAKAPAEKSGKAAK